MQESKDDFPLPTEPTIDTKEPFEMEMLILEFKEES